MSGGYTGSAPRDCAAESEGGALPTREITAADVLAWLRSRPGISWEITIRDVEKAVAALSVSSADRGTT